MSARVRNGNRVLVLGGNPEDKVSVPAVADFSGDDWLAAPHAEAIAAALIKGCPEFEYRGLEDARIAYLWKLKGPEKPRRLLGKCQRPSGLLKRFSQADFVIWFATNNCRGLTAWQFEALVFHELNHAQMESGDPMIKPHDFEGFASEIERYGLWKSDIERIAAAVKIAEQGKLSFFEDRGIDRPEVRQ